MTTARQSQPFKVVGGSSDSISVQKPVPYRGSYLFTTGSDRFLVCYGAQEDVYAVPPSEGPELYPAKHGVGYFSLERP